MKILFTLCMVVLSSCSETDLGKPTETAHQSKDKTKEQLLLLERKWLEAEFALDTAYISTLMDTTFISIAANRILNKQEELKGMYDNVNAMRQDSIFLDSLKLEEPVVNIYGNTAIVAFVVHTYKKERGKLTEKRTRFYDVWISRGGKWKAVSSQGTALTLNK